MAARKIKIKHDDRTREKIKASQLINFLQNHVLSNAPATKTQISAALGLLKKVVPDLQAVQHSGGMTISHEEALSALR
jgi:hypothetical protein